MHPLLARSVLVVSLALAASGCALFKPQNKLEAFMPDAPPPPEVTTGQAVMAFQSLKAKVEPRTLKDDDQEAMLPPGAELLGWYPVSEDWEVGRNEYDAIIERYAQAVLVYKHEGKCFWTGQNVAQPHMGGGTYGRTAPVVMARTRLISKFPCPQG
jgi:hypothetical protein